MRAPVTHRLASALLFAAACLPVAAPAQQQKKGNDAAIQRQAEQIRRLTEAQQKLQGENSNLAAQKSSLEDDLKAAREKLDAAQRQGESRLATARRDLKDSDAKAAALGTELEQAKRELARQAERLAGAEQQLAALREQAGGLQASVRTRDEALARSRAAEEARTGDLLQCRDHNQAIASLAGDMLTAIDRARLGDALVGSAPFDGYKRVHVETLIRRYREQIADHRALPPSR